MKEGNEDSKINAIWFCIEGTSSKLFPKAIKDLSKATAIWKTVPVIVVITKSYSVPERAQNIEMVEEAFANQKRYSKNLKHIVPVVASTFTLNDTAFAAPEGITELIDATNALMPEGIKAGAHDIYKFKMKRKKALAQSIVAVTTTAAVTVGAIPVPFADALILTPIEVGTVSVAAKTAISALKAIPGINIGASVLNAIMAGVIVAAIGEGSIYVFEKIYTGEKSVEDIDWVKNVMESELSSQFIENVTVIVEQIVKSGNTKNIGKLISSLFSASTATKE